MPTRASWSPGAGAGESIGRGLEVEVEEGRTKAGLGDRGSAGQDREARSPAGYEAPVGCRVTPAGQLSCSVTWSLGAFFHPCACIFVQRTYVKKSSYILSFHGPGHRNMISCPGS